MDAVGPDHDVGCHPFSVGKNERYLLLVLLEADAPVTGLDDLGWKPTDEHGEQIRTVHAVELDRAGERGRPHGRRIGSVGAAVLRIDPPGTNMHELVAEA